MSQEKRIAENESFSRDLNKMKADWLSGGVLVAGFRCECWRIDCGARMQLSRREWEEVRSRAERFAVVPEHTATHLNRALKWWSRNTSTSGSSKSAARQEW